MKPVKPFDSGHGSKDLESSCCFSLAFCQYFLTSFFWNSVVQAASLDLRLCNLLFDFYMGTRAMRLPWLSSDLLKFELLSTIKSKRPWGALKLSKCILQYDMATRLRSPGSGIRWFEWKWFPNLHGFEYWIPVGGTICEELGVYLWRIRRFIMGSGL